MEAELKSNFIDKWRKYFPGAELPVAWFYSEEVTEEELRESETICRCLIGNLSRVREGYPYIYGAKSSGCLGGKRYTGYSQNLRKNFEYFLSYGIEGEMEGERYKKSPELVNEQLKFQPAFSAPAKYLVFKRWDKLSDKDEPAAVIFFAGAEVISGLFTLANYDFSGPNGVITPFGSGCASIIQYALEENKSDNPRCIMGMFDISARPYVPAGTLSFTVPFRKFEKMVENMDESFLITESWNTVKEL